MRNSQALKQTLAASAVFIAFNFSAADDANATGSHHHNNNGGPTNVTAGVEQNIQNGNTTVDVGQTTTVAQNTTVTPTTNVSTGPTNVGVETGPTNVTVINQGTQGGGHGPINAESGSTSGVEMGNVGSNSAVRDSGNSSINIDGPLGGTGGKGGSVGDVAGGSVGDVEGSTAHTGDNKNDNNSDADSNSASQGGSVNQHYGRPGAMPGILGGLGPNLHVPQECGSGFGFSVFGGAPYLMTIGGGMSKIDTGFKFENGHTVGDILGAETSDQRQKMMEGLSGADNRRLSCVVGYAQIRMTMQEAGYNRQEDLKRMDQDFTMTLKALDHLQASGAPGSVESFLAMRVDHFAEALQSTFHALRRAEAKGKITRADIDSPVMKPSVQVAILEELFLDPAAMRIFKDAQRDRQEADRNRRNTNPWQRRTVPAPAAPVTPETVPPRFEPGM